MYLSPESIVDGLVIPCQARRNDVDHARGMSNRQDRSMAVRTGMQIITGDLVRFMSPASGVTASF